MRRPDARRVAAVSAAAVGGFLVAVTPAAIAVAVAPAAVAVPVAPAAPAAPSAPATPLGVSGGAGTPEQHQGEIFSFGITVPTEPIGVGDSIVFPNNSDRPHTITDRGGTFDTDEITPGTTGEVTFEVPGNFEVFCRINPSTMNALVRVEPGPGPPPAARVQLYDEFREGESRRFDPADLEVDLGAAITVANVGGLQHSFEVPDVALSTGTIEPGAEQGAFAGTSAELVVDKAGEFETFCSFFPDEMRGTLRVVDPEPAEDATPPSTAGDDVAAGDGGGAPPAEEAAESPGPPGEDDDLAGTLAAGAVLVLGVAAVLVALVPRRRPKEATP